MPVPSLILWQWPDLYLKENHLGQGEVGQSQEIVCVNGDKKTDQIRPIGVDRYYRRNSSCHSLSGHGIFVLA